MGTAGLNKIQVVSVTYDPLRRQAAALSLVVHRWAIRVKNTGYHEHEGG